MEALLLLLTFPLVWPFFAKRIWHNTINWQEMVLQIGLVVLVSAGVWSAGIAARMYDVEILNGEVLKKAQVEVPCEHSYSCNCRTNKDGSESCDTCYEHPYDYAWRVFSNVGPFDIGKIDRRGSSEPPRFTKVKKGDPVAREHAFKNYIKASSGSLFHKNSETLVKQFKKLIPEYPNDVYDYQFVDRVFAMGVSVPDIKEWNRELSLLLRELGPKKQANVIIVFVNTGDSLHANALEAAWLGGKKNDIIVVLGVPAYPAIDWVSVISWTDKELFKVELRDDIYSLKAVDRAAVLGHIRTHTMNSFVRKQMADFEYLTADIEPPMWVIIIAVLIAIGGSLALTVFFHKYEIDFFRRGQRR